MKTVCCMAVGCMSACAPRLQSHHPRTTCISRVHAGEKAEALPSAACNASCSITQDLTRAAYCEQVPHLLRVGGECPCPVVACTAKVCERPLRQPNWAPISLEEALQVCLQRCCGSLGVAEIPGVSIPTQAAANVMGSSGRCYVIQHATAKQLLLAGRRICTQHGSAEHVCVDKGSSDQRAGLKKGAPVNGHEIHLVLVCFDLH